MTETPKITITCPNCNGTGIFPEKTMLGKEQKCNHCDGNGKVTVYKKCPFRRWNECINAECMLWDSLGDCVFKRLIK